MNPNENTGRWTQEEHERFLQGLELFGKKWTKVAEVVRTRTTVQVRSHAQKYFQKMVKGKTEEDAAAGTGAGVRRAGLGRGGLDIEALRKQIPVPQSLQPYLPAGGGDVATGLYRYLSPNDIPTGTTNSTGGADDHRNSYPSWFQQAKTMDDLLGEASQLDWVADTGTHPGQDSAVPPDDRFNTMQALPPPPASTPALEPNFSSMDVDDNLFETLINDDEFMAIAQDEDGNVDKEATTKATLRILSNRWKREQAGRIKV